MLKRKHLALAAGAAAALALPASAGAAVDARYAGMETGNLSEFDQASTVYGTLKATTNTAAAGTWSATATYSGGGQNGYARGIHSVAWQDGDEVTYEMSLYLPSGFHSRMQGQVALLRWDNWPTYGSSGDTGGIVIYGNDRKARLVRAQYGSTQVALLGGWSLPEGRWFRLTVHQRLSTSNPYSAVYLDGVKLGETTAQNSYGRRVDRLRYGLVAISAGAQTNSLTLHLDEARIKAGAPSFTSEPAPAPEPEPEPTPEEPANTAPAVSLTAPVDGSTVGRNLDFAASASDDRGVAKVEFLVDGRVIATDGSAPYDYRWRNGGRKLSSGWHTVTARAHDAAGLTAESSVRVYKR